MPWILALLLLLRTSVEEKHVYRESSRIFGTNTLFQIDSDMKTKPFTQSCPSKENLANVRKKGLKDVRHKNRSQATLCNICGLLVKHYNKHLKSHGDFTCKQCFQTFKTQIQLANHTEIHFSSTQYNCDICNMVFKSVIELTVHKFIHTNKYVCPICGFHSTNKGASSIKAHILRHEEKYKFRCDLCDKGFLSAAKLHDHKEVHEGLPKYECEICHKKFSVKNYLKLHIGYNHKKEVYGIEETFQCEICGRKFTFEKSFRRHLGAIHKIGKDLSVDCPVCNKTIANPSNLKKHMRIHTGEKNFACGTCGKKFSDKKYVKKHQSVHLREMGLIKRKSNGQKIILQKLQTSQAKNIVMT